MSSRQVPSLLLGTVILLVAADILLWGHVPGWTAAPFALLTAALLVARRPALWTSPPSRVAFGVLVLGCGAIVLDAGTIAVLVTLGVLFVLALAGRHGWSRGVGEWTGLVLGLLPTLACRLPLDLLRVPGVLLARLPRPNHGEGFKKRLAAAALPLTFLVLFTVANPVLWKWFRDTAGRVEPVLDPWRWLWWLALSFSAWALLRARSPRVTMSLPRGGETGWGRLLDRDDVLVRTLAGCNAVFLIQTLLDARYLLLGSALPPELTYAQYAQRGAYPLLLAAVLAGLFVLWAWRDGAAERSTLARWLVFPWLAQTLFLTAGAALRLQLYVSFYGLTRLRLAAALWMLLVTFGLGAIVWRLLSGAESRRLVQVNLAATLGLLIACSYANLDGTIASHNVKQCRELGGQGAQLDLDYLRSLGEEALPALREFEDRAEIRYQVVDLSGRQVLSQALSKSRRLRAELEAELELRYADPRAWTIRRVALVQSPAWFSD